MDIVHSFQSLLQQIEKVDLIKISGKVTAIKGNVIECVGISEFVAIGTMCNIVCDQIDAQKLIKCQVIGFNKDIVLLLPLNIDLSGLRTNAKVIVETTTDAVYPDESWLGRVLDAFSVPIDNLGPLKQGCDPYLLKNPPLHVKHRERLGNKLDLGVKAIDVFTSCCSGQRMGIFGGSGVGKSMLISMLTKYANTDVKVIGLVGERSREVKEFIEDYLGEYGLKRSVVIVATGDEPALIRRRAAYFTVCIAEYFRDQGKEVLCIIDSITRFAMAQREIGLAAGEPPTSKGYTPSVFAELPQLLERVGPGVGRGNITGLFSVLVEGDDHNEPISDSVRAILDGHIVLDRSIADRGRFPAINVLRSISRAIPKCNTSHENKLITYAKRMLSIYDDMSEMIRLGAYKAGADPEVDKAIVYYTKIEEFLTQLPSEEVYMADSYQLLAKILGMKLS